MDKQYIEFSLNGSLADIDYLTNVLGYEVEFQADEAVFVTGNTSETGEINEAAVAINDEFEVKVVLTKDGEIMQSEFATVRVVNLNATPQIGDVVLENVGSDGNQTPNAGSNDFVMNSSTLVTGETGAITGLRSATGQVIGISGTPTFTSSNPGVATVVPNGATAGTIQAVSPGTTTITVKAGTETFTVALTVTGETRELSSGEVAESSLKFAPGASKAFEFNTEDQYGDPIALVAGQVEATSNDEEILGAVVNLDGTVTVDVEDDAPAGDYTIYLRDAENNTLLDSISVEVTEGNTVDVTKTQLQLAVNTDASDIDTVLNINEFTVDNGFVSTELSTAADVTTSTDSTIQVGSYTVTVANEDVAGLSVAANSGDIVVDGLEDGFTDITVRDANGISRATYRVTVEDDSVRATAVNFLRPATVIAEDKEVSVTDLLDIDVVEGDDIVNGLTLNTTATSSSVRIVETDGDVYQNAFYLDVNDNGTYNAGTDVLLGSLVVTENPGSELADTASLANLASILTTEAGDEGELIFSFLADADGNVGAQPADKVLTGTTTVNIVVPGTPAQ